MGEEDKRITTEIIRESLAQKFAVHINDVEVLNFKVEEGIKAGENFNCVMKAVEAKALIAGEEKKAEFMVKVMPMSEQQIKWLTTVRLTLSTATNILIKKL